MSLLWLHASNQGIEQGDWMEHWTKATRPASSGEHWDVVYYVPACYPPLGKLSVRPSGLRFILPVTLTRDPYRRLKVKQTLEQARARALRRNIDLSG